MRNVYEKVVPNIWIFDFYLHESPSGIVGSETLGNGATKIVILDKPIPHCRKSNVIICLKPFNFDALLHPNVK
jgi:hypothetical protein